ncbi:MAG: hypothetical protein RIS41_513 [Actinomycetota bacterium]
MPTDLVGRIRVVWTSSAVLPAVSIWSAVYAALVVTGVGFDTGYLNYGWQLIPWDVLTSDPWRSLWYLHVQPPGWNLFLGAPSWISPLSDRVTVQALMLVAALLVVVLAVRLAERLGLGRRAATALALVATLHPEVLKGAFEPNYELGVAALLLAVCLAVLRLDRNARFSRAFVVLSIVLTVLVMTRSLYHPILIPLILVPLGLWGRRSFTQRGLVVAVLVPLVVVGGWMVKNQALFGHANLSSWFGMNLQRAVIPVLDLDELEEMYADGAVSDIAMIGPFGRYSLYESVVEPCEPSRAHRSLAEPMRTTDPVSPNFNYECFLPLFDQAGEDAWAVIREHPEAWLEGRLWSLRTTFAVADRPGQSSSIVMRVLDDVYSVGRLDYRGVLSTEGWGTPIYGRLVAPTDFGLILVPVYGALVMAGVATAIRGLRRRSMTAEDWTIGLASSLALFTVVVGAVAELGEQSRFRTAVDPLATVVVGVVVVRLVGGWRTRRVTRRASGQSQAESVGS